MKTFVAVHSNHITRGAFKSIAVEAVPGDWAVTGLRWGLAVVFSKALQVSAIRVVCASLSQPLPLSAHLPMSWRDVENLPLEITALK